MSAANFLDAGADRGLPEQVDVLIVGSGPSGSAYARRIADLAPRATMLMVEAGPRLTERPGTHVRNIADLAEREVARRRSEGPDQDLGGPDRVPLRDFGVMNSADDGPKAMPGVAFVDPRAAQERREGSMYAAAIACNVGGMGSHWAGATPSPRGRERISFLSDAEWDTALTMGKQFLAVSVDRPAATPAWAECLTRLGDAFDSLLPSDGRVQDMPSARSTDPDTGKTYWTGPDVILGDLASSARETFAVSADTLCRELLIDDGRVAGALLEHLPTGRRTRVLAKAVVVAGDSLRTPQLLWASGIRPAALGHYLNDHATVGAFTVPEYLDAPEDPMAFMNTVFQSTSPAGTGWIPYSDDVHPLHGQLGQIESAQPDGRTVGMVAFGYFLAKDIRFEDCVRFSADKFDVYGMPAMEFDYGFTERDREMFELADQMSARAMAALGGPFESTSHSAPGSSLHYMGSVRMGEYDDGESVCDSHSRVWGYDNLFVGGNGVIPTSTACNPTLTNVSLAARAAERVVGCLG